MSWFKYNFIIISISLLSTTFAFDDMSCLDSNFDIRISHKGWPLGLLERNLHVKKAACEIELTLHYNLLMKKNWIVDVCREPVHVKFKNQFKTRSVLRKNGICPKKGDAFCESSIDLQKVVQDNGLVYAKGEKEQLGADHGKVYCAYLLIKKYSDNGFVFSREEEYKDVIQPKSKNTQVEATTPAPLGSGQF